MQNPCVEIPIDKPKVSFNVEYATDEDYDDVMVKLNSIKKCMGCLLISHNDSLGYLQFTEKHVSHDMLEQADCFGLLMKKIAPTLTTGTKVEIQSAKGWTYFIYRKYHYSGDAENILRIRNSDLNKMFEINRMNKVSIKDFLLLYMPILTMEGMQS